MKNVYLFLGINLKVGEANKYCGAIVHKIPLQ